MKLEPAHPPQRSINLATPDFLVMNGTAKGGRSHWQDVLAALPMLRKVDEGEPMNGLGVMREEMGEVTGALCECLANGLQAYMMRELTAPTALSEPVELPCDFIENNPIPYFYANR